MSDATSLARTLPGRLALWARERPDGVGMRHKRLGLWREMTWAAYYRQVETVGHALRGLGVHAGDVVAILSDNRPEWVFVDLATQGLGGRSAGIYQTSPPEDVAYILNHSRARVVVCEDQEQVDKVIAVRSDTPAVQHVIVLEPRGTRGYDDPRLVKWADLLQAGDAARAQDPDWFTREIAARDPAEPSMLIYTSGTTGTPKGAQLSSANVISLWDYPDPFELSPDDVLLSYLPLCHVAEKLFTLFIALRIGCVVHFGESLDTVQEDLREVSPTLFLGVPRIWEKMHSSVTIRMKDASWLKRALFGHFSRLGREIVQRRLGGRPRWTDPWLWRVGDILIYRPLQERLGLRRCRYALSGAAPIAPELLLWFCGVGIPVYEGYGMTENGSSSHVNRPGAVKLGTVGQALAGVECRLADDGEIMVRGPNVFCGYLDDIESTARAIDREGWLRTGDLGEIDQEGFLRIIGRKKEIIITSGGKNISPEKVENTIKLSPYVKEAIAVGDGRNFLGALVQIDYEIVSDWAARRGIGHTDYHDLAGRPEVAQLVALAVDEANRHLAGPERIRIFRILPKELRQEDGELTATRKVRRRAVLQRFESVVNSIYDAG